MERNCNQRNIGPPLSQANEAILFPNYRYSGKNFQIQLSIYLLFILSLLTIYFKYLIKLPPPLLLLTLNTIQYRRWTLPSYFVFPLIWFTMRALIISIDSKRTKGLPPSPSLMWTKPNNSNATSLLPLTNSNKKNHNVIV